MLEPTDFINKDSEVRDVRVAYGRKLDYANLKPAKGYTQLWPVDMETDEVEKIITVKENIVAPVEEGDVLGKMELSYKGETLAVIDLISTTKVERSPVKERARVVKAYFGSKLFKITGTIVLVCIGLYCVLCFLIAQRKYLRKLNPSADSRYDDSDDD
jgi:D-alanyl-D-alanine carboxypeptidase (penicillin-binding protein 5/6)